ncbi:MAG TPA: Gfo/Idh/MocA family oxidoreductase [Mesotoga infera]|nr:Gfo/Idh/MocA family oxidoreductase [Mesotoga infera]
MTKVRLGIVGAGIASRELHLPALRKLDELYEITAVNSRTVEKAEDFARLVGTNPRIFRSYDDMLGSGEIDAVVLAVPISLNPGMIKRAVEAKVPVICEKPVAPNISAATEMLALSREAMVYIAENYRHIPVYREAAKMVSQGKIGRPVVFSWQKWVAFGRDNKYVQTAWRQSPKHIGGFISDGGVHDMAALRAVLGEVLEVSGFSARNFDFLGAEDTAIFNIRLESGVAGDYSVFYGSPVARNRLDIVGDEAMISIDKDMAELTISGNRKERILVNKSDGFVEEFRDFYRVLNGQKNVLGSVLEALKDLAIVEAGLLSSKERKIVGVGGLLMGSDLR